MRGITRCRVDNHFMNIPTGNAVILLASLAANVSFCEAGANDDILLINFSYFVKNIKKVNLY